jgi:hypothetical protein
MTKSENLRRLEELFRTKEVVDGFPSQQACLSWSNKVAPLLRFNEQYYGAFTHNLYVISANVSTYTAEPAFRVMLNQVEMAIEELRLDTVQGSDSAASDSPRVEGRASIFKFEPNFHGIGLNMNELFRRIKSWRKARKR